MNATTTSPRRWFEALMLAPMAVAAGFLVGVVGVSVLWCLGALLTGAGAVQALAVMPFALVLGLPMAFLYGLPVYLVLLRFGWDRGWVVVLAGIAIPLVIGPAGAMGASTLLMTAYGAGVAGATHVAGRGMERIMSAGPHLRPPG